VDLPRASCGARTRSATRGADSIYWDESKSRFVGAVSLGHKPDGTRIRKKGTGQTKAEVRDKLRELHQEVNSGLRPRKRYTVGDALEDWLAHGVDGLSARTGTFVPGHDREGVDGGTRLGEADGTHCQRRASSFGGDGAAAVDADAADRAQRAGPGNPAGRARRPGGAQRRGAGGHASGAGRWAAVEVADPGAGGGVDVGRVEQARQQRGQGQPAHRQPGPVLALLVSHAAELTPPPASCNCSRCQAATRATPPAQPEQAWMVTAGFDCVAEGLLVVQRLSKPAVLPGVRGVMSQGDVCLSCPGVVELGVLLPHLAGVIGWRRGWGRRW
jgi:hypothetical protein